MTIALVLALALQIPTSEHARLESVTVAPAKAKAGDTVKISLQFKIDKDWHIYSARATGDFKTTVALSGIFSVSGPIEEPTARRHKDGSVEYDYLEGDPVLVVAV